MNERNEDRLNRLNALADGELDAAQSEALLESIEQDARLREDLCDIHRLKDMVRYAYADSQPPARRQPIASRLKIGAAAAAVLLFGLGFMGGMVTGQHNALAPFELSHVVSQPNKVVLFIGYSDHEKFQHALDRAEHLLTQFKDQGVEVDVVASAGGIDLLRKSSSPYLDRIKQLSDNFAALQFVACNNTIARMIKEGKQVELIENAVIKPSAVQFVVERLQQGWSYIAI